MTDTNEALTKAVRSLDDTLKKVDQRLSDDYPKRTEIERRFQSRLDARKHITRITFAALLTVVGCYGVSTGAYAVCFVGDDNPSGCSFLPGYQDRIERRDQINRDQRETNLRIKRLEDKIKKGR